MISNPGDYRGSIVGLFLKTPIEIQYLLVLLSLLMTLLGLIPLLPQSTHVRITNQGILYKGVMSLIKKKSNLEGN